MIVYNCFIAVFAAESSYLGRRQLQKLDCIAGVYDKFYRTYDKAWQAQNRITQNEAVRLLHTE